MRAWRSLVRTRLRVLMRAAIQVELWLSAEVEGLVMIGVVHDMDSPHRGWLPVYHWSCRSILCGAYHGRM